MKIFIALFMLGFLIVVVFAIKETVNLKTLKRQICAGQSGMLCSYFDNEERILSVVISFDYVDETVYIKDELGNHLTIPLNDIYGV